MTVNPRVWFVTGSSSGFGRLLVEVALSKGDNVVATLRKPDALSDLAKQYPPSRLLLVTLDVRKASQIAEAFAKAKETFGRIDVVFNNAGYGMLAEVEGTPDDAARELFETDFWGAAKVSTEAVKFFRESNPPGLGGRLLVTSSFVGLKPLPCSGFYSAAKHALEGVTDSLAHELDPSWNIKVTLIEPGTFLTPALHNAVMLPAPASYTAPTVPAAMIRKALMSLGELKLGDPSKGIQKIYELSSLSDPPLRLVLGKDAIDHIRSQQKVITADLEKYESWSDDLKME